MELLLDSRLIPGTSGEFRAGTMSGPKARSACTTPCSQCLSPELPTITVSDSQLLESVSQIEDHNVSPEPSVRRSRLERMKSDVAKLGKIIRHDHHSRHSSPAGSFSNGSSPSRDSLSSRDDRSISPESRRITVEYQDIRSSSQHSIHSDIDNAEEWNAPDHNFSSSLLLTSLQDGYFSAEISLRQMPMEDLVLSVSGHELEIIIDKGGHYHKKKKHKVSVPYHYGVVDLPIFVDTSSLVFAKDSERNVLVLQGNTKGCFNRRRSVSFDSLPLLGGGNTKHSPGAVWRKVMRKFGFRRSKSHGTIVEELKPTPSVT